MEVVLFLTGRTIIYSSTFVFQAQSLGLCPNVVLIEQSLIRVISPFRLGARGLCTILTLSRLSHETCEITTINIIPPFDGESYPRITSSHLSTEQYKRGRAISGGDRFTSLLRLIVLGLNTRARGSKT